MTLPVTPVVAQPLDPREPHLPETMRDILKKASCSWLKNTEVHDILLNYTEFNLRVAREPPFQPPGGSLFLFDRKAVRFFRKDKHSWRKKPGGKTVRETHEKLKIRNVDMLNCYYSHADSQDGLQSQQAGRHMLTEDNRTPFQRKRDSDSQPHPFGRSDPSRSPDSEPAVQFSMSSPPSQAPHFSPSAASYPNAVVSSGVEDLAQLSPSFSSMDMLYSVADSKHSLGAKPSREGALHSNAAVQQLLHSWENENQSVDLPFLQYAHDNWQPTDNFSAVSSRMQKPPQLQSHLLVASNGAHLSGARQDNPSNSWGDEPPPHKKLLCTIRDKAAGMCPNPFLDQITGRSGWPEHRVQLHHQPSTQCPAQASEAPIPAAKDSSLSGAGVIGSFTETQQQLQPQDVGAESQLTWLGIRQLQELLGMGRNPKQPRKHQLQNRQLDPTLPTTGIITSSTSHVLLPQNRQHTSFSPLLQPSMLTAADAGPFIVAAPGQLPTCHSLSGSQAALWSHPEALGARTSQHASLTVMPRTHGLPAGELPQDCSEALQPQLDALLQPFQTALQSTKDTAARQPCGQTWGPKPPKQSAYEPLPSCYTSVSLPSAPMLQSIGLASTEGLDNSSKSSNPSSSMGVVIGACQSQAASTLLPQASLDMPRSPHEQLSQGRSPSMTASLRPNRWRHLPNLAPPSSNALSGTDPASNRPFLQGQSLQCQPASAISSITSKFLRESQWFESPEAIRQAALMLNAQLARIDKQVLEHVVPHCGLHGTGAPGLSDASIIQTQVEHCENQLRQLELTSQQLLQVSAEQDSKVTMIGSILSQQGSNQAEDRTGFRGAASLPDDHAPARLLSDCGSTTYPMFDMLECGPTWDYTAGGAMLLLVASGLNTKLVKETCRRVQVMFDKTQVSTTVMWPGVLRCIAPAHKAGAVRLCLTLGDAQPCSKVISFVYKEAPASVQSREDRRPTAELSDRHLQLQLLHVLLQEQAPLGSSSSQEGASSPVCLPPTPGPPSPDMPAVSMNRSQLLQELFKLELDCQAPQGAPLCSKGKSGQAYYVRGPLSHPAALNALSTHGVAMLHLVAGLGYDWACMSLIRKGADSNLPDAWGLTALHWAASRGHEACVAILLARQSDPTCTSQASLGTIGKTAADMASSAGHLGIAAFLSEASLVQALCKAQTGKLPATLTSLTDCQASQQQPAVLLPTEVSKKRKRQDGDDTAVPRLSAGLSSARDPQAPINVADVVVRAPAEVELLPPGGVATNNADDSSEALLSDWANHRHAGASADKCGSNLGDVLVAAKQAAAVLKQDACRQSQQRAKEAAQQMHRHKVALQRLHDSTKMWSTLKRIAQAQMANSSNQATDPVTLRFLSLAPRIAHLNQAVHNGLVASGCAEADGQGAAVAESSAGRAQRAAKLAKDSEDTYSHAMDYERGVQHLEAMAATQEGCAQYERLVGAVKGHRSIKCIY